MRKNYIQKRLRIEGLKRVVETLMGSRNFSWWAIFFMVLILVVAEWLPDGIGGICAAIGKAITTPGGNATSFTHIMRETFLPYAWPYIAKISVSSGILFWMLSVLKKNIASCNNIEVDCRPPGPMKHLVIILSVMNQKEREDAIQNPETIKQGKKSWEMSYLAVQYHLPRLKRLSVITSSGENGTTKLFSDFEKFIKKAFSKNGTGSGFDVVELSAGGIDFEKIDDFFRIIENFYKQGINPDEAIVDITGGQKTSSIAGALATLSLGRRFQYISTADKKVSAYDIEYFQEDEVSSP